MDRGARRGHPGFVYLSKVIILMLVRGILEEGAIIVQESFYGGS
jgi:hypothetical protein